MFKSLVPVFIAAAALPSLVNGGLLLESSNLHRRQALEPSDVPSQCTSDCQAFFADSQRCGSQNLQCLCTSGVRNDGILCLNCVANVFPSDTATLQSAADQSVQSCSQHGTPIDPIRITGNTAPPISSAVKFGGAAMAPVLGLGIACVLGGFF